MTETKKMELELERKKAIVAISKAETAKTELDMKITESELNIARMRDHFKMQDDLIAKNKIILVNIEKELNA